MFGEVSRCSRCVFGKAPWLFCRFRNFWMFNRFSQHLAGWIDQAFRESSGQSDDSTGPNFMCPCLLHPFTRLRLTGTVLRCAGSGWLFEAIWQGRQRCLVQWRIARSDARRGVRFVEFRWDGPSWSTFGRNSEGTRKELGWLGRSVDSRVLRGSCNLRPGRECQELQVGEVARKRPEIFKFPKPTNLKKKRVSLVILFMFLPLPKFKLLNLLHFHLYTCKTTLFLVFAVVQWVVFISLHDLGFTMVFLTLPMYNLQSHESTAWHASRGKCRKGAEQQQPGCKLQLDSLPVGWNHTSPQVVASFAARNMDNSHPTLGRKVQKKV